MTGASQAVSFSAAIMTSAHRIELALDASMPPTHSTAARQIEGADMVERADDR
jgi:hypothetical protein